MYIYVERVLFRMLIVWSVFIGTSTFRTWIMDQINGQSFIQVLFRPWKFRRNFVLQYWTKTLNSAALRILEPDIFKSTFVLRYLLSEEKGKAGTDESNLATLSVRLHRFILFWIRVSIDKCDGSPLQAKIDSCTLSRVTRFAQFSHFGQFSENY
jgi:hypothetical protein